jgi:hypothetical protein
MHSECKILDKSICLQIICESGIGASELISTHSGLFSSLSLS